MKKLLYASALTLLLASRLVAGDGSETEVTTQKTPLEASSETENTEVTLEHLWQVRSFDELLAWAKQLSRSPYTLEEPLPKSLAELQYDDYIKIAYRNDRATWFDQDLPFWLETFHRGFVQRDRVDLFSLTPSRSGKPVCQRIRFSKDDFRYGDLDADRFPPAGHAGLKIVGRFPDRFDGQEMLSFLGSSYFRGRTVETIYGSSARGLAVDIGLPKDEEFPKFKAFWVEMPEPEQEHLHILALLDSPTVVGAYRFVVQPETYRMSVDVEAELHFRSVPEKLAIAPLTSMWIWGDGLPGPPKDARPSVHDSDGLLIRHGDDQYQWRVYSRQSYPSLSSTQVNRLLGFGVLQRNRAFYHYDDHNARYDKRPSIWVAPKSDWGTGRIELLELPGAHEGIDNIAAYFVPTNQPELHKPLRLNYRVDFFAGDPPEHRVLARATNLDVKRKASTKTIEIEIRFAGPSIRYLGEDSQPEIQSSALRGRILEEKMKRTDTGDWILTATIEPDGKDPVELRWLLNRFDQPVSETVAYLLPVDQPEFEYPAVYTRQ